MLNLNSGIYKITNIVTFKAYIGSAKKLDRRFRQHRSDLKLNKHGNRYLQRAWNKYGEQSFIFEVIERCEIDELIQKEQYYLDLGIGKYNIRPKAESNLGLKWTDEQRARKKANFKGFTKRYTGGKPAWNKGIPADPIAIKKLREFNKGKRYSPATEFKKGETRPEQYVQVYCVELDRAFESISSAAIFCGHVSKSANITAVCAGRQKTAYGYTWRYLK